MVMQRNMIREATAFLLDVLKPNLPEHALLQTKVCSGLLHAVFWYKFAHMAVNFISTLVACWSF